LGKVFIVAHVATVLDSCQSILSCNGNTRETIDSYSTSRLDESVSVSLGKVPFGNRQVADGTISKPTSTCSTCLVATYQHQSVFRIDGNVKVSGAKVVAATDSTSLTWYSANLGDRGTHEDVVVLGRHDGDRSQNIGIFHGNIVHRIVYLSGRRVKGLFLEEESWWKERKI
jgi:hypothetical protein